MVAGLFPPPDISVDACRSQSLSSSWVEQKVIDPQTGVPRGPLMVPVVAARWTTAGMTTTGMATARMAAA